ncbi:MAG: putative glycoside hydrolase, partial [Clostridia bacterium]|nr:putative glycoside hydrolase [Clostridia bacterium]
FVFVIGIYDKVDFSTEKKVDCDIMQYESLYNPQILMPLNEKIYYVTQGLRKDLRPVKKEPVKVKGVYMSGNAFNSTILFSYLIDLVDKTELNAIVIDMKDDDGFLTTNFDIKLARDLKVCFHKGIDAEKNMKILLDKNIYPIARIVVFKDPSLAESKPEFALRCKDGTIWRDRKGLAWVDPHNKGVWEYTVDVAKEAAKMGFREIQFDYVRFPSDGNMGNVVYPYADGRKKEDVIKDSLKFAREELEPYNVYISADVFGLTTMTKDDMGIGQKFEKVITEVDYVCPMIYPSHYGKGNYGFANPNAYPYEIVKNALLDGLEKVGDSSVVIRPWLQDFNLGNPKYGANEVKAQMNATYDVGLEEWILWNARNRYTAGALGEN